MLPLLSSSLLSNLYLNEHCSRAKLYAKPYIRSILKTTSFSKIYNKSKIQDKIISPHTVINAY